MTEHRPAYPYPIVPWVPWFTVLYSGIVNLTKKKFIAKRNENQYNYKKDVNAHFQGKVIFIVSNSVKQGIGIFGPFYKNHVPKIIYESKDNKIKKRPSTDFYICTNKPESKI